MDSGKSTMVAVLTNGADGRPLLDNGRGSTRMAVFRHKHEIESGRTSSISQQVWHKWDREGSSLQDMAAATVHVLCSGADVAAQQLQKAGPTAVLCCFIVRQLGPLFMPADKKWVAVHLRRFQLAGSDSPACLPACCCSGVGV